MFNPNNPGPRQSSHFVEAVARNLGVAVTMAPVVGPAEIETTIPMIGSEPGAGLIAPPDGFLSDYRKSIIELAARYRLPAIYGFSFFATEGGLASYGIKGSEQFRQAADYVNRILRGEKAGELPVQQPTKYELAINLKTAKTLGFTVPSSLLATADEVIE
jgi:putative tryptophan/tyrosine transport system substrate-binding protein